MSKITANLLKSSCLRQSKTLLIFVFANLFDNESRILYRNQPKHTVWKTLHQRDKDRCSRHSSVVSIWDVKRGNF